MDITSRLAAPIDYSWIHGWSSSPACWSPLLSFFTSSSHQTIALAGHGGSDGQVDIFKPLKAHQKPFILVGWSLGSLLAADFASTHPEMVAGLILFSPIACFIQTNDWPFGMPADTFGQFKQRFFKKDSPDFRYFHLLAASGSLTAREDAEQLGMLDARYPPASTLALQAGLEMLGKMDIRQRLPLLSMPVLLISGIEDKLVDPESVRQMSAMISDAECLLLPDAGHLPHISHPTACAAAISSWRQHAF